jgi:hypothetical protein
MAEDGREVAVTVHLVTEETMDELLADYRERRSRLRREVQGAAMLSLCALLLGGGPLLARLGRELVRRGRRAVRREG